MRGVVKECMNDTVLVEFSGTGVNGTKTAMIKKETYDVFNTQHKREKL